MRQPKGSPDNQIDRPQVRLSPRALAIGEKSASLTHYLFRYPAKFHPPVVRTLIETYTTQDDLIYDPFCGSGTMLVEALVTGRSSVGSDVDPVAVQIASSKIHRYKIDELEISAGALRGRLKRLERSSDDYSAFQWVDIPESDYLRSLGPLKQWVPAIPNLLHWFRRYVVIDLAKIRRTIVTIDIPETHRQLFATVFASIIRNSSNADPVPVSGLEVTSHMLRRDEEGRVVNPFGLFERALAKAIAAHRSLHDAVKSTASARVFMADATRLKWRGTRKPNVVITSPPYHGAVDYYRRHQLEMFWLGATETQAERQTLRRHYIGRLKVPQSDPFVVEGVLSTALAKEWEERIRKTSAERAVAFHHYMVAMTKVFGGLGQILDPGTPVLMVVGQSTWNTSQIPTTDLFAELTHSQFSLDELLTYPVKNRYMSYKRHHDANIDREYVLVLHRREH